MMHGSNRSKEAERRRWVRKKVPPHIIDHPHFTANDLSVGGMRLCSSCEFRAGDTFNAALAIDFVPMPVKFRVVWHSVDFGTPDPDLRNVYGVEFLDIKKNSRGLIEAYLNELTE